MDENRLLPNIDKIHTTKLGKERIKNNLNLNNNVVEYLKRKLYNIQKRKKLLLRGRQYYNNNKFK